MKSKLRSGLRNLRNIFYAIVVRLLPKELVAMAIVYRANEAGLNNETPLLILFGHLDGLL